MSARISLTTSARFRNSAKCRLVAATNARHCSHKYALRKTPHHSRPVKQSRRPVSMTTPKHAEARLIRRIFYLRTLLHFVEDAIIVVTLKEFIADTEAQLVSLKSDRSDKTALH